MRGEAVLDTLCSQEVFRRDQKAHHFEPIMKVEAEVLGIEDTTMPVDKTRVGVSAPLLVERPHPVLKRLRGIVEGRHALEYVPETNIGLFREMRPPRVT